MDLRNAVLEGHCYGMVKTHLQHVAIAAAINIDRIVAWLDECPRAQTRLSRFAALAPGERGQSRRDSRLTFSLPLRTATPAALHRFFLFYTT